MACVNGIKTAEIQPDMHGTKIKKLAADLRLNSRAATSVFLQIAVFESADVAYVAFACHLQAYNADYN